MKIKISVIVAFISIISVAATYAQTYPEGMVAYWMFDESSGLTAFDVVGDNDGTLINGPQWTVGQVVNALSFDGINDYVRIPNSNSLNFTEAVTVEAWVKPNGNPMHYQMLLDKGTWSGNASWFFFVHRYEVYLHYNFGVGIPGTTNFTNCPMIGNLEDGVWSHIVGTYDRQNIKFYVNGVLNNQVPWTEPIRLNSHDLYVGMDPQGWYYKGDVDEVAIYNRALTETEIRQHYQKGLEGLGYEIIVETVDIDIKPDSDLNSINLCSNGVVPIAILGSDTFNVLDVYTESLRFAEASVKVVGKKDPRSLCSYEDVNGDSFDDLVCNFVTADIAGIDGESTSATVNGELLDGTPIEGADSVNIVKDTCY